MNNIEVIFDKLFNYYNVNSIKDLANIINTQPSTVSNWKQRSSVTAIKKKCRELGIYEDIFPLSFEENDNNKKYKEEIEIIYEAILDDTKYRLKEKLKNYTDNSFIDWINKLIPKKILDNTLKQLAENKEKYNLVNSKHSLLERIQTLELSFVNEKNRHQISDYIKNNLSKIECYVLIQEHEEIMNYKGFWK